jgi:hypothetical protein
MGILGKVTGKMLDPKKVKKKLADTRFQAARSVLIKGLPVTIRQGYKEQKEKGINPTVESIFSEINRDNLDFYFKMDISYDYIRKIIKQVLDDSIDKK